MTKSGICLGVSIFVQMALSVRQRQHECIVRALLLLLLPSSSPSSSSFSRCWTLTHLPQQPSYPPCFRLPHLVPPSSPSCSSSFLSFFSFSFFSLLIPTIRIAIRLFCHSSSPTTPSFPTGHTPAVTASVRNRQVNVFKIHVTSIAIRPATSSTPIIVISNNSASGMSSSIAMLYFFRCDRRPEDEATVSG